MLTEINNESKFIILGNLNVGNENRCFTQRWLFDFKVAGFTDIFSRGKFFAATMTGRFPSTDNATRTISSNLLAYSTIKGMGFDLLVTILAIHVCKVFMKCKWGCVIFTDTSFYIISYRNATHMDCMLFCIGTWFGSKGGQYISYIRNI